MGPLPAGRIQALAWMYGLSCQFHSRLFPGQNQVTRKSAKLAAAVRNPVPTSL